MQQFIIWLIITLFFTGAVMVSGYKTKEEWDKWRKSEAELTLRPVLYIKPNIIEYSNWSEREIIDDPVVTSRCERIILYFTIHNKSVIPASDVDIKVTSSMLQETCMEKLYPMDIKNSYGHNLHLLAQESSARQPFVLGLEKKLVKYFNEGKIKVKLIVNVKYKVLNSNKEYWSESAFIYSPTFNKQQEIYSRGI